MNVMPRMRINVTVDMFAKHSLGQNIGLPITRADKLPSPTFGNLTQST